MPSYPIAGVGDLSAGAIATGVQPTGVRGFTNVSSKEDYPLLDPMSGKMVSAKTGKPWTGKGNDGNMYQGGVVAHSTSTGVPVPGSNETINPNDPNQRYRGVDIVKQPGVSAATDNLLKTFTDATKNSLQDFNTYLSDAKGQVGSALDATKTATNIGPTADALQSGQSRYVAALDKNSQDYAALNAQDAATQRGIVSQAQDVLPEYDAAAKAVADQQMQAVRSQVSRYKAGSGTPTSLGSDEQALLARGAAQVYAPMEQAKIARKLDLLTNVALPTERDITGRETTRIGSYNPAVAAAEFSSGQNTTQAIQALKQSASAMDWQSVQSLLQVPAVAAAVRTQIQSGDAQLLQQLSALYSNSRYQGLQDVLGANLSQPQYFSQAQPAPSAIQPRYPQPGRGPGGSGDAGPGQSPALGPTDSSGNPLPNGATPFHGQATPPGTTFTHDSQGNVYAVPPNGGDGSRYGKDFSTLPMAAPGGNGPVAAPAPGQGKGFVRNADGTIQWLGADAWRNFEPGYGSDQYANTAPGQSFNPAY